MDLRLINFPKELHAQLKIEAIKKGMTLNNFSIELLNQSLKNLEVVKKV